MENPNILSIKIVSVDHYNSFPIQHLDVNRSEFRGSVVKQVPIVRIFGITQNKKKICANVHGYFPYFYVPCAETSHDKILQLMKDLAVQLDKHINISLGQSNASAQHIYRISLVKGKPFYGFHHGEHQFLRIQLYNPNVLRRVAGIAQSGSILGKQFQPHESHIPYILKFFIDYNLFGMTYLHIPLQFVHARNSDDKSRFKKRSVSQLEVDFKAIYILNRLAAVEEDLNKAANPGIESIWEEERLRRNALDIAPPSNMLASQSNDCLPTESDVFYRTILKDKLAETSNESTMELTISDERSNDSPASKKKFNLKNFLDASVYAAEFSQNSFSTKSSQESEMKSLDESVASQTIQELEDKFLNFHESPEHEEKELQDMFEMLDEYPDEALDNDSLLAPLTQTTEVPTDLNQSQIEGLKISLDETSVDVSQDSDDEMFNDLNVTVANMEIFSQYVDNEAPAEKFPQLDGVDDDELHGMSPSEITLRNDKAKNFHLQPGPSHLFISPIRKIIKTEAPSPSSSILNSQDVQNNLQQLASQFKTSPESVDEKNLPKSDDDDEDDHMKSFYNQTMMIDDFESSDEESSEPLTEDDLNRTIKVEASGTYIITPALDPPDPSEVLEKLNEFNIPSRVNLSPFYSNPKDVTGKKEVGHNTLEIIGTRLCDLEDFNSELFNSSRLEILRNEEFKMNFGFAPKSTEAVRDFSTSHGTITICPYQDPPTHHDAIDWLTSDTMDNDNNQGESPIKDKRERTLMVLDLEDGSQSDLNETLVPSTPPATPEIIQSSMEKESTTLAEYVEDGLFLSYSARKKRKKMKKSFSKRFQEIMKAKASLKMEPEAEESSPGSISEIDKLSEETLKASQSSNSSIKSSSQTLSESVIVQNANTPEETSFINSCDLTGPTLNNTYGFKMKLESLQSNNEHTDLTILTMELHVQSRKGFQPNPEFDAISAIFYSLDGYNSGCELKNLNGIITTVSDRSFRYIKQGVEVLLVKTEMEIFEAFFQKIREYDPDIFAGYEIEAASWGYLVQRGYALNMNLNNALSRMPSEKAERQNAPTVVDDEDQHDMGDYYSEQKIPGRILLDVWRLMKHEIALTSYTFENICYHVLHRRYPKHSFTMLTSLWDQPLKMWIVLDYYMDRAITLMEILKQLDLIGRTCELAKLFGIQFYEVLSRGSQFRVESMMIRIAKRRNYVPVSPSVQQRAHMRAPEYIPLILEPESRFYSDPVIVLDFQSLYPSIIIAYNYCFSTCLGRVEHLTKSLSQPFEFGAYQLRVSKARLQYLLDNDLITISPCGVAYVKSPVKEGVLPRMLREILDTRLMVKQSMKIHKNNSALQRVLHSRQLGLKLIANVTYGYTAANFSGRMPAIEVGDSVVSKGRETLERAIKLVESNKEWGCRVCYGDTDSMFVLVPGRSKEEAFEIGEKIAESVTNDNPHPIKLKLEKVYQPCILQTKKRYVGFMYETADQKEAVYEAKGIETVRRDGCPAAAKILEKTLRILFETCDVSKVKEYVCRQFTKILAGRCSIQDLLFAKEFRGINGYKEKACVPSLILTRKWKLQDPRHEPRRGERVPFLIVNGAPGLPLFQLVRSPLDVLQDENYKINSIYYITKAIIPPLNRCLLLIGANVFDWFTELPRRQQFIPLIAKSTETMSRKGTISQFFSTTDCATCDNQSHQSICVDCRRESQKTVLAVSEKIFNLERKALTVNSICESCCKRNFDIECVSLDCPVLYTNVRAKRDYKQVRYFRDILDEF